MERPLVSSNTSCSRRSHLEYRGGPKRLLEVPIGFFCLDVLLHEFCDHLILVNQLLFELPDPLVFEFVDLGFGPLGNLFGPGRFLESPLDLLKRQGNPLMDLCRLNR